MTQTAADVIDQTPDDEVEHVVVLIPGIREFGEFMTIVGTELRAAGLAVAHTSISYFNVLQFLLPWPFRQQAVAKIREDIETTQLRYPNARVSVIAHSFGSYCVAHVMKSQFRFRAHRIIFCGSVLSYRFPFNQINNRFQSPILNDVGTADIWPALAQAVTVGYGAVGTRGFGNPLVTDRFHNHQKHGYFFEPGFCTRYWVPFLTEGRVVPGDSPRAPPPWYIRLILIFQVKYLLAVLLACLLAYLILVTAYPARSFSYWTAPEPNATAATEGFFSLGAVARQLQRDAIEPCPMPSALCNIPGLPQMVLGREFPTMLVYTNELASMVSCQPFRYPPDGSRTRDPLRAIEAMRNQFPACMEYTADPAGVSWTARLGEGGMVSVAAEQGAPFQLCQCGEADIARFRQSFPGVLR